MIIKEFYEQRPDGVKLYRTYSDSNYKILQNETNAVYDDAIDVEGAPYTYSETNELIEPVEEQDNDTFNAARILFGKVRP